MILQNVVGPPVASFAAGGTPNMRAGQLGDQIVQELHGRYYEQAYRKNMFFAYAQGQLLSLAGTAMTGLVLWNGSSLVNMVLQKVSLLVSVASATMTGIALASTAPGAQNVAPTTVLGATRNGNCFLGGPSSQITPYTQATTLAQTVFMQLLHNTASIQTVGVDQCVIDLEGSFIIPPNTAISLCAMGAASAAAAVTATMLWEEVPV